MAGLVGDIADKLAREAMARGDAKAAEMWGGVGRAALHAVGGGLLGGVNDVSGMIKGAFGGATSVLIAPYVDQLVAGPINDTSLANTTAGQSLANIISSGLVMGSTGVVGGGEFNRTLAACEGGDKAACAHVEELRQLSASRDTKLDSCAGNSTAECVKARRDLRIAAAQYLDAALAKGGDNLDELSLLDRHFVFLAASQHADANDAWDNRDLAPAQNDLKSDAAKKLLTANKDQTWGILRDPIILGGILYGGVGNAKTITGSGKNTTNEDKSQFEKFQPNDPIRPDLAGHYSSFFKLIIDPDRTAGKDIFRLAKSGSEVIVSEEVKRRFEAADVTGAVFKRVTDG